MKQKTIISSLALLTALAGRAQDQPDTPTLRSHNDSALSRHYNSLAWHAILANHLDSVGSYLAESIRLDPLSPYPHSNLPLYYLLTGQYRKATKLYHDYKDKPFVDGRTFKDEFLLDFNELKKAGITIPRSKKIIAILHQTGH